MITEFVWGDDKVVGIVMAAKHCECNYNITELHA